MPRPFALYQVAFKILLRRGKLVLWLKSSDTQFWDLPGGRINVGEEHTPLEKILAREVGEELGSQLRYRLGKPILQFHRPIRTTARYKFITVYNASYQNGSIKLSHEHSEVHWLNPRQYPFRRRDFGYGEEYQAFRRHFGWK